MKRALYCAILALWASVQSLPAATPQGTQPFTWSARDGLGRTIGTAEQYGTPRKGKTVGMFFVIWHGTSGYDQNLPQLPDEGVRTPQPSDTLSPYDNHKLLEANPQHPAYGPEWAFHHWGEPYLGYYVANDRWVIRKHAQMLSDAGVDVIIIDLTNAVIYLPQIKTLCEVYTEIRREGGHTPQLSFIFNTKGQQTVQRMYDNFYKPGLYKDLWFYWKGKPLILCPPQDVTPELAEFFTTRHSWFCSLPEWEWFGDGHDKWPWADYYPQHAGWHDSPDKPEAVSVAAATHPITDGGRVRRVGRSYHDGHQPDKAHQHSEQGLCFAEQFSRAMELDPEFIFFTGWNEWMAVRFIDRNNFLYCGDQKLAPGDAFFWDLYNHEYSRDIEPLRGDFGDNYYYQLADFIRQYKGAEPTPIYKKRQHIDLHNWESWQPMEARYTDDRGDTYHRNHFGYGRIGQLINNSGRNDIVETRVANDGRNLYFYVRTTQPLTAPSDSMWMQLLIDVKGSTVGNWEGFQYIVGRTAATDPTTRTIEQSLNGWNWRKTATATMHAEECQMALSLPMDRIGITDPNRFTIDFKWVDNALREGDIQECLADGDSAPNGRFRYRYVFQK